MSKERLSVTVDPEVAEFLDQSELNNSALVNKLLKEYMKPGENDILEFRKQQVKSEYEELAIRARNKLEEYNELEAEHTSENEEVVREAVETLGIDPSVGYDHAAAENWAAKTDLSVAEFWERYTEAYNE